MNVAAISRLDCQWAVYIVSFPEPVGRRPAIILSSDKYSDGGNATVVPTTTTPPKGKMYDKLWIPIQLESNRLSYIKMNAIYTVNRDQLIKPIGFVHPDNRESIMERWNAIVSGADVERLADVPVDEPVRVDVAIDNVDIIDTVVSDVVEIHDVEHPCSDDDVLVSVFREMLLDKTINTAAVRHFVNCKKLTVASIPKDELIVTLIAYVRHYGYMQIRTRPTTYRRYKALIGEMTTRGDTNLTVMNSIDRMLRDEFPNPIRL